MSRILKRPMFKRGGQSNDGIMSNVVDREQYSKGTDKIGRFTEDEFRSKLGIIKGIQDRFAPLPRTRLPLGEVGLALASGADPIDALSLGYSRFVKADDARQAAAAKRDQAAVSTVLGQALKEKKTPELKENKNISNQTVYGIKPGGKGFLSLEQLGAARNMFTTVGSAPALTEVKNISGEELYGIESGKTGFLNNEQLAKAQSSFKKVDKRMITIPDGKGGFMVMPYEEYKSRDNNKNKAQSIGTEYTILNNLIGDMKIRAPDTPTGALGVGYGIVEAGVDQFRQIGEDLGIKDKLEIKNEATINNYLKNKGFTDKAVNFATMKSSVISLAYALARIAEPNNPKYSEGDIIRQLDRINFGGSRKVFLGSLDQILKEEGIRATATIQGLGFDDPNPFFNITQSGDIDKSKSKDKKIVPGSDQNYDPLKILGEKQ